MYLQVTKKSSRNWIRGTRLVSFIVEFETILLDILLETTILEVLRIHSTRRPRLWLFVFLPTELISRRVPVWRRAGGPVEGLKRLSGISFLEV